MQTINYNHRFLISDNQVNPLAWQVSSRDDLFPLGVTKLIFKQDLFDPAVDNKELMIANYYSSNIEPIEEKEIFLTKGEITCPGADVLKVGGSSKTLSCVFKDADGIPVQNITPMWTVKGLPEDSYETERIGTIMKISVKRDFSLIGKILTITAENPNDGSTATLDLEVVSL